MINNNICFKITHLKKPGIAKQLKIKEFGKDLLKGN